MKQLVLLNLISCSLFGQFTNTMQLEENAASPAATLEIMNWLRGEWVGEGLGGLTALLTVKPGRTLWRSMW